MKRETPRKAAKKSPVKKAEVKTSQTETVVKTASRKTLINPVLDKKSGPIKSNQSIQKVSVSKPEKIDLKPAGKSIVSKSPVIAITKITDQSAQKESKSKSEKIDLKSAGKDVISKQPAAGLKTNTGKVPPKKPENKNLSEPKLPELYDTNDTIRGESKKFEIEDKRGYIEPSYKLKGEDVYKLSEEYGETKITLLIQDPYWVYAYWEINAETRKMHGIAKNSNQKQMVLRVYEASLKKYFDIPVNDNTKSWYLQVPQPNMQYFSEIGYLDNGKFKSLARSNTIYVPTDKAAPMVEKQSGSDQKKNEALFEKSGGHILNRLVGSQVVTEWTASPIGLSSASGGISSGSGGVDSKVKPVQRGFWAELHTELIIYGATSPDAKVTIGGVPVKLTDDGKFSIRFYLKDGQHTIPFVAKSHDSIDIISMTPFLNKNTERKEFRNN